jgi:hypothetical protein
MNVCKLVRWQMKIGTTELSVRLRVPHTTISRVLRRFREVSEYTRRPGQGKPRVTRTAQIVF